MSARTGTGTGTGMDTGVATSGRHIGDGKPHTVSLHIYPDRFILSVDSSSVVITFIRSQGWTVEEVRKIASRLRLGKLVIE